jgi:hypothetical protein
MMIIFTRDADNEFPITSKFFAGWVQKIEYQQGEKENPGPSIPTFNLRGQTL